MCAGIFRRQNQIGTALVQNQPAAVFRGGPERLRERRTVIGDAVADGTEIACIINDMFHLLISFGFVNRQLIIPENNQNVHCDFCRIARSKHNLSSPISAKSKKNAAHMSGRSFIVFLFGFCFPIILPPA